MFSQSQSISLETLNNRQLIPQYNLQSILDQINPQIKSLKLDSELSFILGFTIGKYNSNIEQSLEILLDAKELKDSGVLSEVKFKIIRLFVFNGQNAQAKNQLKEIQEILREKSKKNEEIEICPAKTQLLGVSSINSYPEERKDPLILSPPNICEAGISIPKNVENGRWSMRIEEEKKEIRVGDIRANTVKIPIEASSEYTGPLTLPLGPPPIIHSYSDHLPWRSTYTPRPPLQPPRPPMLPQFAASPPYIPSAAPHNNPIRPPISPHIPHDNPPVLPSSHYNNQLISPTPFLPPLRDDVPPLYPIVDTRRPLMPTTHYIPPDPLLLLKEKQEAESQKLAEEMARQFRLEEEESKRLEERQTAETIRKLMKEEENEINKRRLFLEEAEEMPKCEICLEEITATDLWPLDKCGHLFHIYCMKHYLDSMIEERKFPLNCPRLDCKLDITNYDLREILKGESYGKFEANAFQNFVDYSGGDEYSYCPHPDCKYVFVFIQGHDPTEFTCPICNNKFCLNCRTEFHVNMSCAEYQEIKSLDPNDRQFIDFAKGMKFKSCPKCKFWVSKTEGCDHMKCRCGKEFCYACGGDYPKCHCK